MHAIVYVHMYICNICIHACLCVYDHHKGSQGTHETLTRLLWLAMTWYFIPAREWSCFPHWWQVNISWRRKASAQRQRLRGETACATSFSSRAMARIRCRPQARVWSTWSPAGATVLGGRGVWLKEGGLGVGLPTPAFCPDSTAMWKALTQAPGTPGEYSSRHTFLATSGFTPSLTMSQVNPPFNCSGQKSGQTVAISPTFYEK